MACSTGLPVEVAIRSFLEYYPSLGALISMVVVFINSLFITRLSIRNAFFLERSYMPALVYLLVSSGYYSSWEASLPLMAAFMILMGLSIIFKTYNHKKVCSGQLLMTGFYFGLAYLFYLPSFILCLLLIPLTLSFLRLFDLREWLAAFFGFMLPLFFSCHITWLFAGNFNSCISTLYDGLYVQQLHITTYEYWHNMPHSFSHVTPLEWTFIGAISVVTIMSLIRTLKLHAIQKAKPLKVYKMMVCFIVLVGVVMIVYPNWALSAMPIMAIPLAVIVPNYYNGLRPTFFSNFLYALILGSAISIQILSLFF